MEEKSGENQSWKTYIKTRDLALPTFSFCKERFIPIWCFFQTTALVALKFSMPLEVKLEMTAILLPLRCQKGWPYLDLLGKRTADGKYLGYQVINTNNFYCIYQYFNAENSNQNAPLITHWQILFLLWYNLLCSNTSLYQTRE